MRISKSNAVASPVDAVGSHRTPNDGKRFESAQTNAVVVRSLTTQKELREVAGAHKGRFANAVVAHTVCTEIVRSSLGCSTRRLCSANAVKAQCMYYERRESVA